MFEVSVEESFSSGHYLRGYRGNCEKPHGHNYKVRITVQGESLDEVGLLFDFRELKTAMNEIIDRLDHQMVNDLEPFDRLNPSAENMAKYFYDEISGGLGQSTPVQLDQVRVWETDTSSATYRP